MRLIMTSYKILPLFALIVFLVIPAPFGYCEELSEVAEPEPASIHIVRGAIDYNWREKTILIEADDRSDPSVFFREFSITAKTIHYDETTEILSATGEVRLWDRGTILRGDSLRFNLKEEKGTITNLQSTELTPGIFFKGETLEFQKRPFKTPKDGTEPDTADEYTLYNGSATTNDLPYPFYYFEFSKTLIVPDVRFWAHDIIFVSNSIPLMYAPLMTRSLADHVVTYYFNADYDSDLGFTAFNRISIKPGDEWQVNLYGDYYTKAGIGKGAKFQFDLPGEFGPKGMLYGYHLKQEAPDNDRIFDGKDRYHFAAEYEQDLPYDMRLSAKGHRLSDSEYRWDYRHSESMRAVDVDEIQRDSVSFVNLSKWWDDQSLRLTASSRLDPFYYSGLPFIEREPQIHFEQYPLQLFNTGLYTNFHLDYGRYRREEGVTFPLSKDTLFDRTSFIDDIDRFDSELKFAYPVHLPYRMTLTPWLGYRATHYGDPSRSVDDPSRPGHQIRAYGFDSETRSMPEGGLEIASRTTYEFKPFLPAFEKMRAVVEPVLSYGYYHPNNDLEELSSGPNVRFPYIDPVDDYRYKMHRLSALLRTKIQGKNPSGTTSDFMRLSAGVIYDQLPDENLRFDNFDYGDDPYNHRDHRYSDLVENFSINPYHWISFGNTLRFDVDDDEMRSQYYYSNIHPIDPINLRVGYYSYNHPVVDTGEQQDMTFSVDWAVSKKWDLYLTGWYDLDESYFRKNSIGIVRDLYDFYTLIEVSYRDHPTLGDDYSIHVGFGFWGLGGKSANKKPFQFH